MRNSLFKAQIVVLTGVFLKLQVLWAVTLCQWMSGCWCLEGT
jgi:hypothetical protein